MPSRRCSQPSLSSSSRVWPAMNGVASSSLPSKIACMELRPNPTAAAPAAAPGNPLDPENGILPAGE